MSYKYSGNVDYSSKDKNRQNQGSTNSYQNQPNKNPVNKPTQGILGQPTHSQGQNRQNVRSDVQIKPPIKSEIAEQLALIPKLYEQNEIEKLRKIFKNYESEKYKYDPNYYLINLLYVEYLYNFCEKEYDYADRKYDTITNDLIIADNRMILSDDLLIKTILKYLELNSKYWQIESSSLFVYPKRVLGEGKSSKVFKGTLKVVYDKKLNEDNVAVKFFKLDREKYLKDNTYTKNKLVEILMEVIKMHEFRRRIDQNRDKRDREFRDYFPLFYTAFCLCEGKVIYIITEQRENSLYDLIDNKSIQLSSVNKLNILINICNILEKLHLLNIKHCDLKSKNLRFKRSISQANIDTNPLGLVDFGSCKEDGYVKEICHAYSAPEVLLRDEKSIDHNSDIFSLGILIWEVFARKHPFENLPDHEIKDKILNSEFPDPSEMQLGNLQEIANLYLDTAAKDKIDRKLLKYIKNILMNLLTQEKNKNGSYASSGNAGGRYNLRSGDYRGGNGSGYNYVPNYYGY